MRYFRLLGVAPSADVSASALEVVREAVEAHECVLIPVVMDRVEERFVLPSIDVPRPCPPIIRGSIGYASQ